MRASTYLPYQLQKLLCAIFLPVWLNRVSLILWSELTYLSGIRQLQRAQGLPEPKTDSMPFLRQVLRDIYLDHSKHGKPTHSRLPITPAILKQLKPIWIKGRDRIPFNNIMLWAACLTTFSHFAVQAKYCRARKPLLPFMSLIIQWSCSW